MWNAAAGRGRKASTSVWEGLMLHSISDVGISSTDISGQELPRRTGASGQRGREPDFLDRGRSPARAVHARSTAHVLPQPYQLSVRAAQRGDQRLVERAQEFEGGGRSPAQQGLAGAALQLEQ